MLSLDGTMELVVIIYGIAWLLSLLTLLYIHFTEKDKLFRRDNWKLSFFVIAFAPFIFLVMLLCILISYIWDGKGKTEASRKEEREREREKEQVKKKLAVENFKKCHDSLVDTALIEQIGRKLQSVNFDKHRIPEELQMMVVGKRIPTDEEKILDVLDKIKILEGYSLELEYPDGGGIGGRTYINIKEPNGNLNKNFFDFMIVENSPLGALQVYLLSKLWHYLPMHWHGYYDARFSVFSKDDLSKIKVRSTKTRGERPLKPSDIYEEVNDLPEEAMACDVTPKVTRYEDKYYVSCCYWSEFGGLIRELVEIKIESNKVTEFLDANREVLYRYHCGIMY